MWASLGLSLTDSIFALFITVSALLGGIRGLCAQVVTWLVWVCAGYMSMQYAPRLARSQWLEHTLGNGVLQLIVVVAGIIILAGLISMLCKMFFKSGIRWLGLVAVDRVLGLTIGSLQGALLSLVVIIGFNQTQIRHEPWWKNAKSVQWTQHNLSVQATPLPQWSTYVTERLNEVLMPLLIEHEALAQRH